MALNQGPQPKVQDMGNGIRYVDPNPTDEIVNHEDLVMYVKLVARSKGRSILTFDDANDQVTNIVEQRNVKSETNFTYPTGKDSIDTSWTNIGGGNLNFGEDLGSFGITNINIEFKSSFMPQIVIDFVDVRGAALFEQGPCSPYAVFFHLPYPVFELTVKGYYGRPVTYTLALTKFNTKFNSDTGNFESKAEFVGYTYAFLADIPMGYVMAAGFMEKPHNGKDILAEKWKLLMDKKVLVNNVETPLIDQTSFTDATKPINVYDLIKSSKKLESRTSELKNSTQVTNLGKINKTKNELKGLRESVLEFRQKFLEKIANSPNGGYRISPNTTNQKNTLYLKLPNVSASDDNPVLVELKKVVETYFGTGENSQLGGTIGAKYNSVNSYYTNNAIDGPPILSWDTIKTNASGFFGTPINIVDGLRDYYIDIYESLLKPIDVASVELNKKYIIEKDNTKNFLNKEVVTTLGFLPTISNVFAIILTNVEVFLELLLRTSRDAEKYHQENNVNIGLDKTGLQQILDLKGTQNNGAELSDEENDKQKNKVYPWPTYYEKKQGSDSEVGDKETYPGENPEFVSWPEVIFVESFIKALTKLKGELAVLELQLENLPGYDNFAPITPYETHAFGVVESPNRWLKIQNGSSDQASWADSIYKVMGENAFIIGDYTMINSLSVWKSQLGFKNGWGVETLTNGNGASNGYSNTGNKYSIKPQRLAENPKVLQNIAANNQLGRYGGEGFTYGSQGKDTDSFKRKIVPATTKRMKDWGYVDALNLMTTLKLDGGVNTTLEWLQNDITTAKKDFIITEIKRVLTNKLKTQKFDEWKVSATAAISGTTALVDQQSKIWNSYFGYVTQKNVLTLTGPIYLNDRVDSAKDIKISANPHNNDGSGAVLVKDTDLTAREIDFSSDSLIEEIKNGYKKYYANTEETASGVAESTLKADISSLAYRLLKFRPKTPRNQPLTAYSLKVIETEADINLSRDKNTNMLTLGDYFAPNFYHTYEKASKDLPQEAPILDLSSSRTIYSAPSEDSSNPKGIYWANFMGASITNTVVGSADSIINTPLWLLNYPLWKNSWQYAESGGDNGTVALDELVSIKAGTTADSFATYKPNDSDVYPSYHNKAYSNQRRNWSTWWGLNQWGVDNTNNIYKPLAYMAVMSFGFDNLKSEFRTGHFPPWDGNSDMDLSSFSNFTTSAIMAYPPKAYILLIGAILWRMKETNLLLWDGIIPTRDFPYEIDTNSGWNRLNKSYLSDNSNIGIDDINDPVWFFHTSTSRPWFKGGSVYAIKPGESTLSLGGTNSSYRRRWLGTQGGVDRWTNGGASISKNFGTESPVIIGPNNAINFGAAWNVGGTLSASNLNNTNDLTRAGWTKSSSIFDPQSGPIIKNRVFRSSIGNITKGWFDQCRPDQMPFILSDSGRGIDFKSPKTLVITNLSGTEKNINYGDKTPNLVKNKYPILKEECKELMFIPKSLKIQFIEAFESWATGENARWLLGLDPLNWNDNGSLDNWSTTSGGFDNSYVLNGYKGFLTQTVRKDREYLKYTKEDKKNYYTQRFTFLDEGELSGTKPKPKKQKKSNSNTDYEPASITYDVSCFVAGSKIKLSSGKNINIEDLVVGDIVLSYNVNTNIFEESSIENVTINYKDNLVIYNFDNGIKITCTDTHPIWVVGKGWSSYRQTDVNDSEHIGLTKQISAGDECFYYSNNKFNKVKISKIIEKQNKMVRVWNVKNVTGNHNFIINNVLVHNVTY